MRDGKEGFIAFFADFTERNPVRDIEIVRSFEDGRYVFLHVVQTLNDGEYRYVTADIFDTDDDAKLIEHWDIIEELRPGSVGGRGQVDGPTDVTDLGETESNKDTVARFVDDVLIAGDLDRLGDFFSPQVVQHSPGVADGVDAFAAFVRNSGLRYLERHRLAGSGNFVVVLAESEIGGKRQAVMDLYRLEDSKIVEHWDVTEEITPEDTWVNSGKF